MEFEYLNSFFFHPPPPLRKMKDMKEALALNISASMLFNLKLFFLYLKRIDFFHNLLLLKAILEVTKSELFNYFYVHLFQILLKTFWQV